jgi:hypothetical protein
MSATFKEQKDGAANINWQEWEEADGQVRIKDS